MFIGLARSLGSARRVAGSRVLLSVVAPSHRADARILATAVESESSLPAWATPLWQKISDSTGLRELEALKSAVTHSERVSRVGIPLNFESGCACMRACVRVCVCECRYRFGERFAGSNTRLGWLRGPTRSLRTTRSSPSASQIPVECEIPLHFGIVSCVAVSGFPEY